ncbi:hypothetical protein VNO78_24014 [Psophocarpus tetragonolobus]|uniref:DUF7950 domain-containing protein n=1 Tax=Psophocarpus tetragonolobus TaxID=3891 RepID=A0AAN9S408_PSOTE
MDGRGGCRIARYVPGASHVSTVHKIMLRFRPIAPKPVAGGTASDGSSSETSDAFLKNGAKKRKYLRDDQYSSKRRTRPRKNTPSRKQKQTKPAVTLPLLPETPDPKDSPASVAKAVENNRVNINKNGAVWMSLENGRLRKAEPYSAMMGGWCSCVTVECVTETWMEGEWLGSTDEERRVKLSRDTCPGFISDDYWRVTWTNEAYRETMMGEGHGPVLLVMKIGAVLPYSSFTCRVRVVQYSCGKERTSLTLPCDVWRMDSGGFAWRLDLQTALSLRFGYYFS